MKKQQVQCNNIHNYRDGGLPEKQVLIKLAAHYHIYMHCHIVVEFVDIQTFIRIFRQTHSIPTIQTSKRPK